METVKIGTIKEKFEAIAGGGLPINTYSIKNTVEDNEIEELKKELLKSIYHLSLDIQEENLIPISSIIDNLTGKVFQEGVTAEKEFNKICIAEAEANGSEVFELTPEELKFVEAKADL